MRHVNWKSLATARTVAALIAAAGLATTAACGNQGSSDNSPKATMIATNVASQAYGGVGSGISIQIVDPSNNSATVVVTTQINGSWGSYVVSSLATPRAYAAQAWEDPATGEVAVLIGWCGPNTTCPQNSRGQLFQYNTSTGIFSAGASTGVGTWTSVNQVLQQLNAQ